MPLAGLGLGRLGPAASFPAIGDLGGYDVLALAASFAVPKPILVVGSVTGRTVPAVKVDRPISFCTLDDPKAPCWVAAPASARAIPRCSLSFPAVSFICWPPLVSGSGTGLATWPGPFLHPTDPIMTFSCTNVKLYVIFTAHAIGRNDMARKPQPGTTGSQVRALRRARGMTQQDLADATGLALATISRIETNKHVPETATKEVIARSLRVPVRELNPGRVTAEWGRGPGTIGQ